MDSPEDGSSCGFVSMEMLECGGALRALKDTPNQRAGHSSKDDVTQVETRCALTGASGKPHMLVFETRPLGRDAWNPKQGFSFGPRGLSASIFCLWGHLSVYLSGGCASPFARSPLCAEGGLHSRDGRRDLGGFSQSIGLWPMKWAEFPWRGQTQSCRVAPGAPAWKGCGPELWGQNSEITNTALVWGRGFGSPNLQIVRGAPRDLNEGRVEGGCSRICLWILCQGWPWKLGVASRALDESPSLGIGPGSQEFGDILWEGWSPDF